MTVADLLPGQISPLYAVLALLSVLVGGFAVLSRSGSALPAKAPKLIRGWPIVGSWDFWSRRVDFHTENSSRSKSGSFTYFVGPMPVIALSGEQGRRVFFDSHRLDLGKGYEGLFAGSPPVKPPTGKGGMVENPEDSASKHFIKRLTAMTKRDQFLRCLPLLIHDTRDRLQDLVSSPSDIVDPFNDIYRIVFLLTMRTVACNEAAEDKDMLNTLLSLYETVEAAMTPTIVMYPGLPSLSKLQRLYGGGRIYLIFDKIVKARKDAGRREDDALQYLMDLGDNTVQIISFIMGALFAGLINSGINAAWILVYLAAHPEWREACRREIEAMADKYEPDRSKTLADRLANVPLEGWENEFPIADACLRESIRLNVNGTVFRQNTSGAPIPIGDGEVIPPDFYATYPMVDIHRDPHVYPDPTRWDPSRYVNLDGTPATGPHSISQTSKGVTHPFIGWGVSRHPCLGMRFAKLEQNIIVAFFMAYFDFELAYPEKGVPENDYNAGSAQKPKEKAWIRYKVRSETKA